MAFISLKLLLRSNPVGYRTRLAVVYIWVLYLLFSTYSRSIFIKRNGGWQLELLGLYTFALTLILPVVENGVSSSNRWD
jgi:hypothetical protein